MAVKHPARFSSVLLEPMARMLQGSTKILDPFGGVGGIYRLLEWLPDAQIEAVEIEPEWAEQDDRITLGNALSLPWEDGYFDAICTSPAYGNRMADHFVSANPRIAKSYRDFLGRDLDAENTGRMQWGARYKDLHERAWMEARRVLREGGVFVLNIKDHIRDKKQVHVTDWHVGCLESIGFYVVQSVQIDTPSHRYGANSEARMSYESVILLRLKEMTSE